MAVAVCCSFLAHGSPNRRNAGAALDSHCALDPASGKWRPVTKVGWDHERFAIHVWRSVRATGDTKTGKSRRTLGVPKRCQAPGGRRVAAPGPGPVRIGPSRQTMQRTTHQHRHSGNCDQRRHSLLQRVKYRLARQEAVIESVTIFAIVISREV